MLSLIIKGNRHQAALAAAERGIPFAYVDEMNHCGTITTKGLVGEQFERQVAEWYHETTGKAYPNGRPIGDVLLWSNLGDSLAKALHHHLRNR